MKKRPSQKKLILRKYDKPLPKGAGAHLARKFGYTDSHICQVLQGHRKGDEAIFEEADALHYNPFTLKKKKSGPKNKIKMRYDIYNNTPRGILKVIADKVGCSPSHVHQVLIGNRNDNLGIIKRAELIAAVHIWQQRFCIFKSELDIKDL